MSRFYRMAVEIPGHDPARTSQIRAAAEEQWPFDDWWPSADEDQGKPEMRAQDSLCAGETEERFVERLTAAIWRANGSYCRVSVDATYLENLPYEAHKLDEMDYVRLTQGIHDPNTGESTNEDHLDH